MRVKKLIAAFTIILSLGLSVPSEGGYALFSQKQIKYDAELYSLKLRLEDAEKRGAKEEAEDIKKEIEKLEREKEKLNQEKEKSDKKFENEKTPKFNGLG